MTLEQLRIFSVVADMQHITRAAEALHLSQSAVSASIASLEGRFGISLFHRVGRRVELNTAGAALLAEARELLSRAQHTEAVLADLAGLRRGRLAIHASLTIVSHWLPRYLVPFKQLYPGVEVLVDVANTARIARKVISGEAELGFVEGEISDPVLSCSRIGWDRFIVVAGADHPWTRLESVGLCQLLEGDWVLRERGSGTRSAFEAALQAGGVDVSALNVVQELPSNGATMESALRGNWVTATSEMLAAPLLSLGLLKRVPVILPARPFLLLRHKQRYFSRVAQAFVDLIRQDDSADADFAG
jgi:DNA-binding transcriptional LysR family regulator